MQFFTLHLCSNNYIFVYRNFKQSKNEKTFLSKPLNYALATLAIASTLFTSCSKDDEAPTPAPPANAKIFTANVTPTTGGGTANVTGVVTTSDGTAYLRMVVTSTENIDHVYITSSVDNGTTMPYVGGSNYKDSLGNEFKAGGTSGASYTTDNTKSFVLMVPVNIRTTSAAVSDVYTIWFTNGAGNFLQPTKKRVLGPVTFKLNYGANVGASYSSVSNVSLGDQFADAGSLLVTSGQVSALQTAAYNESPESADISFSELNTAGDDRTGTGYGGGAKGTGDMWFISPSERVDVGYGNEPATANTTYISTSSVDFDAATGATLSALTVGTGTKVKIVEGGVYQFQTESGKKGLIKVTSLTDATASEGGTAKVSVKVLN